LDHIRIDIEQSFRPPESLEIFFDYDEPANTTSLYFKFSLYPDGQSMHQENGRIKLSDAQYQRVVELIKKIKIGVFPFDDSLGLDGATTRVGMIQGNHKIQLEWWEEAPKEWKPIEKLVKMLREMAKEASSQGRGQIG